MTFLVGIEDEMGSPNHWHLEPAESSKCAAGDAHMGFSLKMLHDSDNSGQELSKMYYTACLSACSDAEVNAISIYNLHAGTGK